MPRTEKDNQKIKEEQREHILRSALGLFARRGLHGVTVSRIAQEAGVSQGLLYHYFSSKEALYTALIRRAFVRMGEAALGLEALEIPARQKVALALDELCKGIRNDEQFSNSFMLTAQASFAETLPEEAAKVIKDHREAPYKAMARIFQIGQQQGSVREGDPDELAILFWTMMKGLAMQRAAFGAAYHAPDPRYYKEFFLLDP